MDTKILKLSGKGLFVFSDPGAGKAVLSLAYSLKNMLEEILIISDRYYSFFKDFDFDILNINNEPEKVIKTFDPSFIFTGTSYTSKIELKYIEAAKNMYIPSFAFIDHWTSLKERFNHENDYIFPNNIVVIDEKAKKIAIEEGIKPKKIIIFGNPYYNFLKNWKPTISKKEFLCILNINNDKKIVVFAPDPLSNINGKELFGFDEIEALKNLKNILEANDFGFNFILKLHPNQNIERLKDLNSLKIIKAEPDIDTNSLIFYSDLIIGFFSNFLIESDIMNKKILRYHLNKIKKDPLNELNIGKIVNNTELVEELNNLNDNK